MRLNKNKNLKYDLYPWRGPDEGYEKFDPENCYLERFIEVDEKLTLFFKNGSQAIIRARNAKGARDIDLIEEKLIFFLEKNYTEIINADF